MNESHGTDLDSSSPVISKVDKFTAPFGEHDIFEKFQQYSAKSMVL